MIKKRYQPLYKKTLSFRENVQNRAKLFKFKKKKWKKFQNHCKQKLKFFKRFKIKTQDQVTAAIFAGKGNSLKRKFKSNLVKRSIFKFFFGGLKHKYLKSTLRKSLKTKYDNETFVFKLLESRLDVVLYRSNLVYSMKSARQLVTHGHVRINGKKSLKASYLLKCGDEVTITRCAHQIILENLDTANFWPIPPKHLMINYKTLQIIFNLSEKEHIKTLFACHLNLHSMLENLKKI